MFILIKIHLYTNIYFSKKNYVLTRIFWLLLKRKPSSSPIQPENRTARRAIFFERRRESLAFKKCSSQEKGPRENPEKNTKPGEGREKSRNRNAWPSSKKSESGGKNREIKGSLIVKLAGQKLFDLFLELLQKAILFI